ncbi:hypothetical protein, partial [Bradyrhizobium sp. 188]|uniref:hypothetical protein n=1 Tax=Bradyrhizobium sp. 188 TaxID=2782656 RepID=UPI001FF734D6
ETVLKASARIGPSVSVQNKSGQMAPIKPRAPKFLVSKLAMATTLPEGFARSRCESIRAGGFCVREAHLSGFIRPASIGSLAQGKP